MATIVTTGSVIRQYNPFTGLSATERAQSGIARAEVVYYNVNDTWSAAGTGNNRAYQTGLTDLPKDFGYVLTDCYLKVKRDASASLNLEAAGVMEIYPGGVLGPQINLQLVNHPARQDTTGSTAIGSVPANAYNTIFPSHTGNDVTMLFELSSKPAALLYPFGSSSYTTTPNPATSFNLSISEGTSNDAAVDVSLYLRFLQYDIDQSYNYVVQSPQLTR